MHSYSTKPYNGIWRAGVKGRAGPSVTGIANILTPWRLEITRGPKIDQTRPRASRVRRTYRKVHVSSVTRLAADPGTMDTPRPTTLMLMLTPIISEIVTRETSHSIPIPKTNKSSYRR